MLQAVALRRAFASQTERNFSVTREYIFHQCAPTVGFTSACRRDRVACPPPTTFVSLAFTRFSQTQRRYVRAQL